MLWHPVVTFISALNTSLTDDPIQLGLGLVGAHLAVFAGGLPLSALRFRLGNIVPCVTAHWAANAGVLLGVWLLSR